MFKHCHRPTANFIIFLFLFMLDTFLFNPPKVTTSFSFPTNTAHESLTSSLSSSFSPPPPLKKKKKKESIFYSTPVPSLSPATYSSTPSLPQFTFLPSTPPHSPVIITLLPPPSSHLLDDEKHLSIIIIFVIFNTTIINFLIIVIATATTFFYQHYLRYP